MKNSNRKGKDSETLSLFISARTMPSCLLRVGLRPDKSWDRAVAWVTRLRAFEPVPFHRGVSAAAGGVQRDPPIGEDVSYCPIPGAASMSPSTFLAALLALADPLADKMFDLPNDLAEAVRALLAIGPNRSSNGVGRKQ